MSTSNPSNFAAAREIVVKLADPKFRKRLKTEADRPGAENEFKQLLDKHGVQLPPGVSLPNRLQNAPPTDTYDKILTDLDANQLDAASVDSITKLGPPPSFNMHCDTKLA